jgi:PleD family two-component response regulator
MIASCPNCAMSLSFDDDRLPTESFNVMCPRCRQSVSIMPPPKEEPKLPGTVAKMDAVMTGSTSDATTSASDPLRALADLLIANLKRQGGNEKVIETARRKILCCLDEASLREKLRDGLDPRYYEICSANTAPEAIETFHESRAEVIILSPTFEAQNQGCGALMQYVNNLTPQVRRRTYVVLVSTQVRTLDGYTAFANGVNLTLHPADISSFQSLFERSVREFNELYRPYNLATSTAPF